MTMGEMADKKTTHTYTQIHAHTHLLEMKRTKKVDASSIVKQHLPTLLQTEAFVGDKMWLLFCIVMKLIQMQIEFLNVYGRSLGLVGIHRYIHICRKRTCAFTMPHLYTCTEHLTAKQQTDELTGKKSITKLELISSTAV